MRMGILGSLRIGSQKEHKGFTRPRIIRILQIILGIVSKKRLFFAQIREKTVILQLVIIN